jgi:3-hydroxypropanoate dehydrogenase
MKTSISEQSVKQLFTEARTHHNWLPESLSEDLLKKVYEMSKWGPTSANCNPLRIIFVRSKEAKEKLYPALLGGNVAQVKEAPVTAILAYDEKFYDYLPTLFPAYDMRPMFVSNKAAADSTAVVNSSLQGAYFILAARALGLDAGPMAGFDKAKVDEAFLSGTSWKSNFLCNIGYGDAGKLYPRGPRHEFEVACRVV